MDITNKKPLSFRKISSSFLEEGVLLGLCQGVMADNQIVDEELILLKEWINAHDRLLQGHPGSDIVELIHMALEEHPTRPETVQSLLEGFNAIFAAYEDKEDPWAVFIGLCYGVLADNGLSTQGLDLLLEWLERYPRIKLQAEVSQLVPVLYQAKARSDGSLQLAAEKITDFVQSLTI